MSAGRPYTIEFKTQGNAPVFPDALTRDEIEHLDQSRPIPRDGQWHQVTLVREVDGGLRIDVDGQLRCAVGRMARYAALEQCNCPDHDDCPFCTGEACAVHLHNPCDCDVDERHGPDDDCRHRCEDHA